MPLRGRKRKLEEEYGNTPSGSKPLSLRYLRSSEQGAQERLRLQKEMRSSLMPKFLSVVKEREFPCESYDKAFAAVWIDSTTVIVGTKCSALLKLDVDSHVFERLPLGSVSQQSSTMETSNSQGGQSSCRIHSVALNPSKTLLATGGPDSSQCAVFDTSQFSRKQLFEGHGDWIFGIDWLDDKRFVTGSRDNTVKLWRYDESLETEVNKPIAEHARAGGHQARVRDVKFCGAESCVASVSVDGFMRLWDAEQLRCIYEFELRQIHKPEITCMAVQDHLIAIGCRSWIAMMDVRVDHQYWAMELVQPDYSVRSLQFRDNIISCGTGNGWISFVDYRCTQQYLELERPMLRGTRTQKENHLDVGKGWLSLREPFREYHEDWDVKNAVYAHCWDPAGTRLFSCGGPLPAGLVGCYMGLWE